MNDLGHWENLTGLDITSELIHESLGFVYRIRGSNSGVPWCYIGRKQIWMKRGKHWHESNWREYTSSSTIVQGHCEGSESVYEILGVFTSKSALRYGETLAIVRAGTYCCLDGGSNFRLEPARGVVRLDGHDQQQLKHLEEMFP